MPRVPPEILELAKSHHRQLLALEKDARARVREELDRAVRRIERDRTFRSISDFRALQLSQIEILARISREKTTEGLERALEDILSAGLLLAPNHADTELQKWIDFHGGEARPLNLAALSAASRDTLIERIPRSLATWGPDVARRVRREISASISTFASREEALQGIHGAINAERWKADRIFRTELFDAYNEAHLDSLELARDVYSVDTKKSAIVTFDARTGRDSLPMHGQVRELDEDFIDGDGRRFLHPPGRPNDREKEIPWLDDSPPEIIPLEQGEARVAADIAKRQAIQDRARARRGLPPLRRGPRPPTIPLTFDERRSALIVDWTQGSNSNSSVLTKTAALEEFGLDGQVWNPRDRGIPSDTTQRQEDLRRAYDATQAFYQTERIGSVRLYRGVRSDTIIEGTVEAWTSDPDIARKFAGPGGNILVADIDSRRILASVDAPGWKNGRFGDQREHLILSDVPKLRFSPGGWSSGSFQALDLDPNAVSAGPWGVLQDSSGIARLDHIPSGRTLLEGAEYTRDALVDSAQYLDRSGFFDGLGEITPAGAEELDDAIDVLRVKLGGAVPIGADSAQGIELSGVRWGLVNQDVKPGTPGKWSRRKITLTEGETSFHYTDLSGVIQQNLAVVTDSRGPGEGYFSLVHVPTGRPLFEGGRTFYGQGFRVPVDIGGYQQRNVRAIGEALHTFFDEDGAVVVDKLEDFDRLVAHMGSLEFAEMPKGETPKETVDRLFSILEDQGSDDEFIDFMLERGKAFSGGPELGSSSRARRSHIAEEKLSEEDRFEEAVKSRRDSLRRGRYARHADADFERAIQAEAERRDAEATRQRLEAAESRVRLGFDVGDGRQAEAQAIAEREARDTAKKEKDLEEAERKRLAAKEKQELAERDLAKKELEKERAKERAQIKADEERRAKLAKEAKKRAELAEKKAAKKRRDAEKAAKKAAKERARLEEQEAKEKAAAEKAADELEKKRKRDEARARAREQKQKLERENFGAEHDADADADKIREDNKKAQAKAQAKAQRAKKTRKAKPKKVPKFAKVSEAQDWAVKNGLTQRIKLKRTYNLDGVNEAFEAIEDMNERFGFGELKSISDQRHHNKVFAKEAGVPSVRGGSSATAGYTSDVLIITKKAFDAEGLNESFLANNAYIGSISDPAKIVDSLRRRSKDEAADRLELLASQGWKDRQVIAHTPAQVMQHELGHRFHDTAQSRFADPDPVKAVQKAAFDPMIRRLWSNGWATTLGRYASAEPAEYAAESMVAYVNGDHHLLPTELVDFYAKFDTKATTTRALAQERLRAWESSSATRIAKRAAQAAEVDRREAELATKIAKIGSLKKEKAGSLSEEELVILGQDAADMRAQFGEGRLADMLFTAWKNKRAAIEEKKRRLGL